MPHRELAGFLRQCDVLVFPSYFEGFGLVLTRSAGRRSACHCNRCNSRAGFDDRWVEGYIIPAGDAVALQDAMQRFIASPGDLATMSLAARRCAERYSWDAYGDRWMEILGQCVTCSPNGTFVKKRGYCKRRSEAGDTN